MVLIYIFYYLYTKIVNDGHEIDFFAAEFDFAVL